MLSVYAGADEKATRKQIPDTIHRPVGLSIQFSGSISAEPGACRLFDAPVLVTSLILRFSRQAAASGTLHRFVLLPESRGGSLQSFIVAFKSPRPKAIAVCQAGLASLEPERHVGAFGDIRIAACRRYRSGKTLTSKRLSLRRH